MVESRLLRWLRAYEGFEGMERGCGVLGGGGRWDGKFSATKRPGRCSSGLARDGLHEAVQLLILD